ncbi:MAG: ADOP family duplicated permease [Longimicrobiales bacterium]
MSEGRWLTTSERWFRLVLRLYPAGFRHDMGEALVETYRDRCRAALRQGGVMSLMMVWLRALTDSLRNGLGERVRPRMTWSRSGNWGRDMGFVMRRLVRAPVFALTTVGTLTIGLGAFAVVYTAVDKVLIEPLPYERPGDLYFVWRDYGPINDINRAWVGGPDIADLDSVGGVIEGAAGLRRETRTLSAGADAEAEEIPVMLSSGNLLQLLGVQPDLGHGFTPDEAGPGRAPVVVLGHDLWNGRFAADTSIIGSEIELDGEPFTVIGVLGQGFRFAMHSSLGPPQRADAYITFPYKLAETTPGAGWSNAGLIRARPGTPAETVAAAVAAVGEAIDERDYEGRGLRLYPVGLKDDLVAGIRPALMILALAAMVMVLVLAVNLATLLLARAAQREREFAVSRALGANGLALARATLLEGGMIGMLGGICASLASIWGARMLVALAPLDIPRRDSIAVDWQIAAIVIAVGSMLGLLAGVVPAIWATRTRLSMLLRNAAIRGGGGHARMRRSMVVVQVALSLTLLTAGGLVVRSFDRILRADPGFEPTGVLTLRVSVPQLRYAGDASVNSLHERIDRELTALPGVAAVGASSALPLSADAGQPAVRFPGAPGNTGDVEHDEPLVDRVVTRPGYFEAMGSALLAGRAFDAASPNGAREALIDRTLATTFFPEGDPVGATLVLGRDSMTVRGVVEHARLYNVYRDGRSQVYVRSDAFNTATLSWALRTRRSPSGLVPDVRAAIRRIDPQLALADIRPMDQVVDESLRQQRLSAVLITSFSLGALLLSMMGLYGVVSGSVTRRRHELAVRLALGADHGRVTRLVLREGVLLISLGLLVGIPGIYFAGQAVRGVLVGVSPFDPLTLAAVASGLAIVAMTACYVPTRRVARIDPARSLRED